MHILCVGFTFLEVSSLDTYRCIDCPQPSSSSSPPSATGINDVHDVNELLNGGDQPTVDDHESIDEGEHVDVVLID